MKNASLKKIGAIALAAVMAVTFAPVASLTAFAASTNASNHPTAVVDGDTVDKQGTYKLASTYTDIAGVTIADGITGNVIIDLNGKTATIKTAPNSDNAATGTVTFKNSSSTTAVLTWTDEATNVKSLKFGNGISISEANDAKFVAIAGADTVPAVKGLAAAKLDETNYYIGNAAISKKAKDSTGENVVAVSGKVTVDELKDTKTATISANALPGTTLSVTAAEATKSLVKVETKVSFKYTGTKNSKDISGSYNYTNDAFYAGAESWKTNYDSWLGAVTVAGTGAAVAEATAKAGADAAVTPGDFTYDRAITLYQNNQDRFDAANAAAFGATSADDPGAAKYGITYYTQNPVKHLIDAVGLLLIDGSKYVPFDDSAKFTAVANLAKTSVELIRGSSYVTDENSNKSVDVGFEATATSVTVKAPSDVSIIAVTEEDGSNVKPKDVKTVYLLGSDVTAAGKDYAGGLNATYAKKLSVDQIAKDALLPVTAVTDEAVEGKVVTKASGIGYFYLDGPNSDDNDFTFGATKAITKEFETKAAGEKTDDLTTSADWTDDEVVFASEEISTTVKGVAAGVTIKGEVSQQVLSEDKEAGTKDWLVNDGKNVPQNVYRLRAKVGNNHLFTMDKTEAENAVASGNWVIETSESFKMLPSNTTVEGAVKVLRFRNVKTNEFLFSTDPAEQAAKLADPEWAEGNVAFCGVSAETGYPVTRLFSTIGQGHLYSTAQAEIKDAVEKNFYHKDGVVFFAVETPEKEK